MRFGEQTRSTPSPLSSWSPTSPPARSSTSTSPSCHFTPTRHPPGQSLHKVPPLIQGNHLGDGRRGGGLTGRNYRQLLERLQARQARLEDLRDRDAGQAQELEAKMRWTNLLYKAEGVRIRDDERLLQEALKRKEKRRAQRQRAWEKRTAHVVGKMQQRQDQRRQNLRKKKAAKAERRLEKARKKGRILPQDLERAGLA